MKSVTLRLTLITLLAFGLLGLSMKLNASHTTSTGESITLYNWGDYIDPDIIHQFEKEMNIQVIYETFDSNEGMKAKIEQGGTTYDIAIPSEYMIEMMKEDDLLLPIQHEKLPHLASIDSYFLDWSFDPHNEYSIPYFWGTVGIAYNPTLLDSDFTFESWDELWDERLENDIIIVDSAREVLGVGLNKNRDSLNETSPQKLKQSFQTMNELLPNVKAVIGDEVTQLMIHEEASVAITWSGQVVDMMEENERITFQIPKSGSNIWFDNIVIPKTAKNIDGAHAFIDFLLRPEIAAQNAEYVGYATPNKDALQHMDPEIVEDERFYPDEKDRQHLEVYRYLGRDNLAVYNEYFLRWKMNLMTH